MTRKETMQELLVKVKAGDRTWSLKGTQLKGLGDDVSRAYNGSLDAALSLFEAVLPGWYAEVTTEGRVYVSDYAKKLHEAHHSTPSRALLIAILEALVGMEEGE